MQSLLIESKEFLLKEVDQETKTVEVVYLETQHHFVSLTDP